MRTTFSRRSSSSSTSEISPSSYSSTSLPTDAWSVPSHEHSQTKPTSTFDSRIAQLQTTHDAQLNSSHKYAPGFFPWPPCLPRKSSTNSASTPDYFNFGNFSPASDLELWRYMLALQKVYHCYHSARISAAVDALENGVRIEDMEIPSRSCLNLLNQELKTQIDLAEHGFRA
ncbi:hypothetical protein F5884DRAFT_744351 [Xylogone sp. PMI_703]|nr:hypothetical protein F5884DRAFT_744351 [Xylogone sp. PMI_703]